MDYRCHKVFTGASFAGNKHGRISLRNDGQNVEQFLHPGAVANEITEVVVDMYLSVQFRYQ